MRVHELADAPPPEVACEAFLDLPRCALLESVGDVGEVCRYSFLCADPFLRLESKGMRLTWFHDDAALIEEGDPFDAIQRELARWRAEVPPPGSAAAGLPPFRGGAIGYFAYDLLHHLERVPPPRFNDLNLPDVDLGLYDWVIAWDRLEGRAWILSTGLPAERGAARRVLADERLELVLERLQSGAAGGGRPYAEPPSRGRTVGTVGGTRRARDRAPEASRVDLSDPGSGPPDGGSDASGGGPGGEAPTYPVPETLHVRSTFSRAGYLAAVERAREYVLAGDVFQVNLSQRLCRPYGGSPYSLYRRLRSANPAPFAALLAGREAAVLSASPERFLRLSAGGRVETRPIKGTTGRGYTPQHDFALRDDLVASEKDRAENVMIVDLLRNDLSRVALDRSVRVPDLWRVERHPTVHHLVSTVTAQLRPGLDAIDLLRATFPGGSITGAPKVRAMEIIHELEPTRRNVYCGSIGYVGFDGEADLSIAIRTVTLKDGMAYFSVGGAVVADSDPAAEYRETLLKAAGLLRAWSAPAAAGVA